MGIRTPDIQLAKLALYQLSYTPMWGKLRKGEDYFVFCVLGAVRTVIVCQALLR